MLYCFLILKSPNTAARNIVLYFTISVGLILKFLLCRLQLGDVNWVIEVRLTKATLFRKEFGQQHKVNTMTGCVTYLLMDVIIERSNVNYVRCGHACHAIWKLVQ